MTTITPQFELISAMVTELTKCDKDEFNDNNTGREAKVPKASVVWTDQGSLEKSIGQFFKRLDKPRLQVFWGMVMEASRLPAGDPDRVTLHVQTVMRLERELGLAQQTPTEFDRLLKLAADEEVTDIRLGHLKRVMAQLRTATCTKQPARPSLAAARRLNQASSCWAKIFDIAVQDDHLSSAAEDLAWQAVEQGARCQQDADGRTPAPDPSKSRPLGGLGDLMDWPTIAWDDRHPHWVIAVAILHARTGTRANQVVSKTRAWAAHHVSAIEVNVSEVDALTQAGWTLLRTGHRADASLAARAAWCAAAKHDWMFELLELSVQLAAVLYAHGETRAAKEVLPLKMVELLKGGSSGGPDDERDQFSWDDQISIGFYRDFQKALADPFVAVDLFRTEWLRALGQIPCTGVFSMWVLAGTFVALLTRCHETAAAATVARVSLRKLEDPADASERQIKAHLSEMCVGGHDEPGPDEVARAQALVDELCETVMFAPAVLDHMSSRKLEGLIVVGRTGGPNYRRIGA